MKQGYVLNLYYNSIKSQAARIELVKKIVTAEAGDEWRVLAYGDHICSIGFFSPSLNPESFRRDMGGAQDEDFCYMLVRVAAMPAGFLYGKPAQWFRDCLAQLATK